MVDIMTLSGRVIGLLLAPGFNFQEVSRLVQDLCLRDAQVRVIGIGETRNIAIASSRGDLLKPDTTITEVTPADFDALIVPGGGSANRLAADERVLTLLLGVQADSKPVAAYGNGQVVLAASGLLASRRVAAPPEIKDDLSEAGAEYIDQELVVDHKLVTSRTMEEITHFVEALALLLEPATSMS